MAVAALAVAGVVTVLACRVIARRPAVINLHAGVDQDVDVAFGG